MGKHTVSSRFGRGVVHLGSRSRVNVTACGALLVASLAFGGDARADDRVIDEAHAPISVEDVVPVFGVVVGGASLHPDLSTLSFHASGTPLGYSTSRSFAFAGKQLGLASPTIAAFELSALFERSYFALGFTGSIGGVTGRSTARARRRSCTRPA